MKHKKYIHGGKKWEGGGEVRNYADVHIPTKKNV